MIGPRPRAFERRLVSGLRRLGRAALLIGKIVDAGAVLRADVVPLPHALRRVVALPEHLEQLVVAHALRVVDDEHRLVVAGPAGADLFVSGIRREPAGIADGGDMNAGDLPELALGAPEAAEPEHAPWRSLAGRDL